MVDQIIKVFKFHMHPELTLNQEYFITPSEFVLTYMYREKENNYIPMISRCALKDMKVNYAPKDVVSTLPPDEVGAFPILIDVDLTFVEMEIMTKTTIAGTRTGDVGM